MKKYSIYLLACSLTWVISCEKKINASSEIDESKVKQAEQRDAQAGKLPVLQFTENEFDFGTINEGDKAEHIFAFTNNGDSELLILDAKPSCGCTVPEFTKEPIAPGTSGEIKVIFDSTGKPGEQSKTVTVIANTKEGQHELKFKAKVNPKK